jgi:hypothetical protein
VGEGEHPLTAAHRREHALHQVLGLVGHTAEADAEPTTGCTPDAAASRDPRAHRPNAR